MGAYGEMASQPPTNPGDDEMEENVRTVQGTGAAFKFNSRGP